MKLCCTDEEVRAHILAEIAACGNPNAFRVKYKLDSGNVYRLATKPQLKIPPVIARALGFHPVRMWVRD